MNRYAVLSGSLAAAALLVAAVAPTQTPGDVELRPPLGAKAQVLYRAGDTSMMIGGVVSSLTVDWLHLETSAGSVWLNRGQVISVREVE